MPYPGWITQDQLTAELDGIYESQSTAKANYARVVGRTAFNPGATNVKNVSSTTAVIPTDGRLDLSCDFTAPPSGAVDIEFDFYTVCITSAANEYIGLAVFMGDALISGSSKLITRRGAVTGQTVDGRFRYTYRLTGLEPGGAYTIVPGMYSQTGAQVTLNSGGAFGASVIIVREAITITSLLGHTYSPAAGVDIVNDGKFNQYPGACLNRNGDVIGAYRTGTALSSGGTGISAIKLPAANVPVGAWNAPVNVISDATLDFPTAALALLSDNRIALTTWARPVAGGTANRDIRIYFSTDDGATFPTHISVDPGAGWLGKYAISESPLVEFGGAWYLGVWGEDSGDPAASYQAGVIKSTDQGATWTRVALFKDFPNAKYNETGVGVLNGVLYAVIRDEVAHGFWLASSTDGITWTAPAFALGQASGAPRPVPIGGVLYTAHRHGLDGGSGWGFLAGMVGGQYSRAAELRVAATFMYGQAVNLGANGIGVFCAAGGGSQDDIYWNVISVA